MKKNLLFNPLLTFLVGLERVDNGNFGSDLLYCFDFWVGSGSDPGQIQVRIGFKIIDKNLALALKN